MKQCQEVLKRNRGPPRIKFLAVATGMTHFLFDFLFSRIDPRLHHVPDERSEVVLDVIIRRCWIQGVIFTSSPHPHHRVTALKTVTNFLHPRPWLKIISAVDVVESVAEFSAPSVLDKLLLHLISASSQSFER